MLGNQLFLILLFIFGTAIGSFIKVLVDRLPRNQSIKGRSRCDYCRRQIKNIDLIPVISYILLGGKCRYCHKNLSILYPTIEIITGLLFVLTWVHLPSGDYLQKIIYIIVVSILIVIFFTDLKYQVIPDFLQIALFIVSLILLGDNITLKSFASAVIASLTVAMPILLLFFVTKGCGMGFGDVKLAFNIGLLLGIKGGLVALYIAFITGALFGSILLLIGKKGMKSKIAFGPFLVIGIMIMIFWRQSIFNVIKRIYGI